jgi:hypothetical protein
MDAESFTDLALRVISGEATDDERRAVQAELSAAARKDEFEQLKLTQAILRTMAPMAEAVRATEAELPGYRVNELRTAVRQHFGPAIVRQKEKASAIWLAALRWLFAGSGIGALACVVVIFSFANKTIEVGLYGSDLMRDGDKALTAQDIPTAKLLAFEQDAPFDQWQSQPLSWNERAKIWVDNEHDLLHIVRRDEHGNVLTETQPLASTNEAQRDQIKHVVESLQK